MGCHFSSHKVIRNDRTVHVRCAQSIEEIYRSDVERARTSVWCTESMLNDYVMCDATGSSMGGSTGNYIHLQQELAREQENLNRLLAMGYGGNAQKYFGDTDYGKMLTPDLLDLIGKFAGKK
jgi:hypothetical protein